MQPTSDMLCLTCPCHHRNDQRTASWQDYLDKATDCSNYIQFLGSALGPHPGIREILESPHQGEPFDIRQRTGMPFLFRRKEGCFLTGSKK